jgi:hypothetical protein
MKCSMIAVLSVVVLMAAAGNACASVATWDVATVHGTNEFAISPDGTSLHYNQQGWTNYVWYNNNGSPPGTVAQGTYGDRTGMRTFATTDVAVGQKLSDLKLTFEYHNALPGLTGSNNYPTINFTVTDGLGHFGIFAPTSSGLGSVAVIDPINGWSKITIDLTNPSISPTATMAVYEQNGLASPAGVPYTTMNWSAIQNLTIAGFYDYQRSPSGGWGAWGTMFDQINTAGDPTIVNGYGLALIWGDTVNSNNSYGSQEREIRNVTVSFGGTTYEGTFANATVPEPATIIVWGLLGTVAVGYRVSRRRWAS